MTLLDAGFAPPGSDQLSAPPISPEGAALSMPAHLRVEIEVRGAEPPWFRPVFSRVQQLMRLGAGWDGIDAPAPSVRALTGLLDLLSTSLPRAAAVPSLVPTAHGGVQAEWHRENVDLEIEVAADGHAHAWMQDIETGELWEGDPTMSRERVRSIISALS